MTVRRLTLTLLTGALAAAAVLTGAVAHAAHPGVRVTAATVQPDGHSLD